MGREAPGHLFADAVEELLERESLGVDDIDIIGSHGLTVVHMPELDARERCTLQIGDGDVLAKRLGIPVVSDFRPADLAVGGQGAPLVPIFDYIALRSPGQVRVAHNIGGISNVTVITPDIEDVYAFDTGPGNMVVDGVVRFLTGGT